MKVIVVGGGKVGYYLAKTLLEHGHEPYIIEIDPRTCSHIANDLDIPVRCGNGTDIAVLDSSGIRRCDAIISVTGKDEDNLITCQLAKRFFNVPRTIAKVNNPKNVEIIKQLGVDIAISSTDTLARLIEREVDTAAIRQLVPLNRGEASLNELQIPDHYKMHGVRLKELSLPQESIIVSIMRDSHFIIPRGDTQILSGDKVLIICKVTALHNLSVRLGLDEPKKKK